LASCSRILVLADPGAGGSWCWRILAGVWAQHARWRDASDL